MALPGRAEQLRAGEGPSGAAGETAKWDETRGAGAEIGIEMNIENGAREEEPETRLHTEN